jgi:hypothetical protein
MGNFTSTRGRLRRKSPIQPIQDLNDLQEGNIDELIDVGRQTDTPDASEALEFEMFEVHKRTIDELFARLASNPYYFIEWHDQSPLRTPLEDWTAFDRISALKEVLSSTDHPSCVTGENQEMIDDRFHLISIILLYQEAIFRINLRNQGWAEKTSECLREAKKLIESFVANRSVSVAYVPAVNYINAWMTLHTEVLKGQAHCFSFIIGHGIDEFERLPDRSKAFIWVLKAFYISSLRNYDKVDDEERLNCLREVTFSGNMLR